MNNLLSIIIPTYNRPDKLARTISLLLPQIQKLKVRILIIDNASDKLFDLKSLESKFDDQLIKIKKNTTNVGLSANICKCFEECETDWMWLLSDDDMPDSNALETILDKINQSNEHTSFINFSTVMYKHSSEILISGLSELSDYFVSRSLASNLLFISTNVYRKTHCTKHLSKGYKMCDTLAPHLAIVICCLGYDNLSALFTPSTIVEYDAPCEGIRWSSLELFCGISSLYNLHGLYYYVGKIMKIFLLQYRWHHFGLYGSVAIFTRFDIPLRWWFIQLMKTSILSNGRVRLQCVIMILLIPFALIPCFRKLICFVIPKSLKSYAIN